MVAVAKKFRFLAGVKVVAQILAVAFLVQRVDGGGQQLGHAVGGHLVQQLHAAAFQQGTGLVRGGEHKGEVLQPETFVVVVARKQVGRVADQFGQNHHVVAQKGKQQHAARLADAQRLGHTARPVGGLPQMVKRPQDQHQVKAAVRKGGQVQRVALVQRNVQPRPQLAAEHLQIGFRQLHRRDGVPLPGQRQAVCAGARADVQNAAAGRQIFFDIAHGRQKLDAGRGGAAQAAVLVKHLVKPFHPLGVGAGGQQGLDVHGGSFRAALHRRRKDREVTPPDTSGQCRWPPSTGRQKTSARACGRG